MFAGGSGMAATQPHESIYSHGTIRIRDERIYVYFQNVRSIGY